MVSPFKILEEASAPLETSVCFSCFLRLARTNGSSLARRRILARISCRFFPTCSARWEARVAQPPPGVGNNQPPGSETSIQSRQLATNEAQMRNFEGWFTRTTQAQA